MLGGFSRALKMVEISAVQVMRPVIIADVQLAFFSENFGKRVHRSGFPHKEGGDLVMVDQYPLRCGVVFPKNVAVARKCMNEKIVFGHQTTSIGILLR